MRLFKANNIPARNQSECKLKFNINEYKDLIIDLYTNKLLNGTQIGKKLGVSCATINSYLKKWVLN